MVKRATVNAAGDVVWPCLSTQEQLTHAIRAAASCSERLGDRNLRPSVRELLQESRREHLRDVARLQKRLTRKASSDG